MIPSTIQDSTAIRLEFECFLRIGQDRAMREHITRNLERILLLGLPVPLLMPRIYFEVRKPDGEIVEMWDLEINDPLAHRLLHFLRRFSPEEMRMMETMMRA